MITHILMVDYTAKFLVGSILLSCDPLVHLRHLVGLQVRCRVATSTPFVKVKTKIDEFKGDALSMERGR